MAQEKQKITKGSFDRVLSSVLNKGTDVDRALEWMEKTFEIVSDENWIQSQKEKAKELGFNIN